jgi:hypothetical protein
MSSSFVQGPILIVGAQYRVFQNFWGKQRKVLENFQPSGYSNGIYQTILNQGPTVLHCFLKGQCSTQALPYLYFFRVPMNCGLVRVHFISEQSSSSGLKTNALICSLSKLQTGTSEVLMFSLSQN